MFLQKDVSNDVLLELKPIYFSPMFIKSLK